MNQIAILLSASLLIAAAVISYVVILTEPGQILSGLYKWLERKLMAKTHYVNSHPDLADETREDLRKEKVVYVQKRISFWNITIYRWTKTVRDYEWIFKPLIGCECCVAGQWALWSFPWICIHFKIDWWIWYHLMFVLSTIYITNVLKAIYSWKKEKSY